MASDERLDKDDIPQADDIERVAALVRFVAAGGRADEAPGFALQEARTADYHVKAAKQLGLLDAEGKPTEQGLILGSRDGHGHEGLKVLCDAFVSSAVGSRWLRWAGVGALAELQADTAEQFLAECSAVTGETIARRASTLRGWLRTLQGEVAPRVARKRARAAQASLPFSVGPNRVDIERAGPEVAQQWPNASRFPHNESGERVAEWLDRDLTAATEVMLVTGYASLDEVIRFVARRDCAGARSTRVIFGNEPFASKRRWSGAGVHMPDEVRDYWLQQGISPLLCGAVLKVRDAVESGHVQVRIGPDRRPIHAKIYVGDDAATIGSSNFTYRGRGGQSEANVRFSCATERKRYVEAGALAEGMWQLGSDYRVGFLALLDALLLRVSWQEALARACAAILEGEWARRYIRADELSALREPLWPHQLQGISQALWVLENVGSVLVADAAGSGKTRMGAWLLRGAHDRCVRSGQVRTGHPAVVAPPQVSQRWEAELRSVHLGWKVFSQGVLSNKDAELHHDLVETIRDAEILAVDEAHNFLNESERTRRLLCHYADHAILFTATPINRDVSDLLAMIELLGADNLSDDALDVVAGLARWRRTGANPPTPSSLDRIRAEVEKFMVRRTRSDLNAIAEERRADYVMKNGRYARYPRHDARYYDVSASADDVQVAAEIHRLASELTGVARLGAKLALPRSLRAYGWTERRYLGALLSSSRALARHMVVDCLCSSRAALYEHVHGTAAAWKIVAGRSEMPAKKESGNTLRTLNKLGGVPPEWAFEAISTGDEDVPRWLWDPEAHRGQCDADARIYEKIAALAQRISSEREARKVEHVLGLARSRLVIAFDSHLISLEQFGSDLRGHGVPAEVFTGVGGDASKKRAMELLGLGTRAEPVAALCSDVLSEAVNLQGASCVVHLDTPTVIRTAEQRAGRVDRMDSPHDAVQIWWPRDPPEFAPRRRDLLRERHDAMSKLIRANLQMPADLEGDEVVAVEELDRQSRPDRDEQPDLADAFRPVRHVVGPGGLVSRDVYNRMRTSQADVVACVSVVRSASEWAFMAVGGHERIAPRWVCFQHPSDEPICDLDRVAAALRSRLDSEAADLPLDDRAEQLVARFLNRLRATERLLLPVRRQRALQVAERVLETWAHKAWGQPKRLSVLADILGFVRPAQQSGDEVEEVQADLKQVADLFLRLIEPVRRRALEHRKGKRLWRLSDLVPDLENTHFADDHLVDAFADVRLIPAVDRRVVAMIVGMRTPAIP